MGKLRSLANAYVPFQVFRVQIQNGGRSENRFFGIDAVSGTLDLYSFAGEPERLEQLQTRSVLPARLSSQELEPLLRTKVQRVLFQTGFFKLRGFDLQVVPESMVHVPYWVALYGAEDNLQMRVMDAVRRQIEGAKVRRLMHQWLSG